MSWEHWAWWILGTAYGIWRAWLSMPALGGWAWSSVIEQEQKQHQFVFNGLGAGFGVLCLWFVLETPFASVSWIHLPIGAVSYLGLSGLLPSMAKSLEEGTAKLLRAAVESAVGDLDEKK